MILGLGMDLVSLNRLQRSLERFGDHFLEHVLTDAERRVAPSASGQRVTYVASRFAAKEAAVKALGTGFSGGITLYDVEVFSLPTGQPSLRLHGKAAIRAAQLGVRRLHLTLTHEREMAGAVVILED